VILFIEHYKPTDPERIAELDATFKANGRLRVFDEIVPLSAGDERVRYGHVFRMCAERYAGRVCVLANADIQFDYTARLLEGAVADGKRFVTLTRWESPATPRMVGQYKDERFYSGSQDVWAFLGGELVGIGDRIPLGYIGCDNAIAGEAMKAGYTVVNPALSIHAWHNHKGTRRAEGEMSVVGTYAYPELTTMAVTGRLVHHEWPLQAT
jgi:hypothetical protein